MSPRRSGIAKLDIMAQEPETKAVVRPLRLPGTYLSVETRQLIYGLVVVLLVTMIGMLLSLQGWKSRAPAFDMVTYFNSAENLLKKGIPAHYGDISSYGSFSPPGTTWLMVPGMLLFNDPRLYEKFGSALLHLGTLVGVFLLARQSLGIRCAYLSVILYGLSGLGLSFAGLSVARLSEREREVVVRGAHGSVAGVEPAARRTADLCGATVVAAEEGSVGARHGPSGA